MPQVDLCDSTYKKIMEDYVDFKFHKNATSQTETIYLILILILIFLNHLH